MHKNLRAFLDMLAYSEIGPDLLKKSDNGYNVLYGGKLFTGYKDHPRIPVPETRDEIIKNGKTDYSTAAGRYQILARYFDAYKKMLKLPDFSPASQDAIAIQLIKECKAMADIEAGRLPTALRKCRSRWASLPGAGYGQPEQKLETLVKAYVRAGGSLA